MSEALLRSLEEEFLERFAGRPPQVIRHQESSLVENLVVRGLPALGPTHASIANGFVHVAAVVGLQLPKRPEPPGPNKFSKVQPAEVVCGGAVAEVYRCHQIIEQVLLAAGTSWNQLVKLTVHSTNISRERIEAIESATSAFAKSRSCKPITLQLLGCAALPSNGAVQVEAMAALPPAAWQRSPPSTPPTLPPSDPSRSGSAASTPSPLPVPSWAREDLPKPRLDEAVGDSEYVHLDILDSLGEADRLASQLAEECLSPEPEEVPPTDMQFDVAHGPWVVVEAEEHTSWQQSLEADGEALGDHPGSATEAPKSLQSTHESAEKLPDESEEEPGPIDPSSAADVPHIAGTGIPVHGFVGHPTAFHFELLSAEQVKEMKLAFQPQNTRFCRVEMIHNNEFRTFRLDPCIVCCCQQARLQQQENPKNLQWSFTFDLAIMKSLCSFVNVGLVEWQAPLSATPPDIAETCLADLMGVQPYEKVHEQQHVHENPGQLMLGCKKGVKWYGTSYSKDQFFQDDIKSGSVLKFRCDCNFTATGELKQVRLYLLESKVVFAWGGEALVDVRWPFLQWPIPWLPKERQRCSTMVMVPAVTLFTKGDVVIVAWRPPEGRAATSVGAA